ncbi:hypothetical protein BaRGS_00017978 [Batillaria attramentaria]|uniref:Uncharacterized protein n=1 Tax=Batillaria attramentaria TaxID=370345 RepID=A0ABD0KV34_9CAEN
MRAKYHGFTTRVLWLLMFVPTENHAGGKKLPYLIYNGIDRDRAPTTRSWVLIEFAVQRIPLALWWDLSGVASVTAERSSDNAGTDGLYSKEGHALNTFSVPQSWKSDPMCVGSQSWKSYEENALKIGYLRETVFGSYTI